MTDSKVSLASEFQKAGNFTLPQFVNTNDFIQARYHEIKKVMDDLDNPTNTKRSFQRLHKEQRRRAMSHNPFRVPTRIKYFALREMSTSIPSQGKSKKRAFQKRRPFYVRKTAKELQQYLSTHIWHAKRMKMRQIFGRYLGEKVRERCERSQYRHQKNYGVSHDFSYSCKILMEGEETAIRSHLEKFFDDLSPLSETAVSLGMRKTRVLWRHGSFPVDLVWMPRAADAASVSADVRDDAANKRRRVERENENVRRKLLMIYHPYADAEVQASGFLSPSSPLLSLSPISLNHFEVTGKQAAHILDSSLPLPPRDKALREQMRLFVQGKDVNLSTGNALLYLLKKLRTDSFFPSGFVFAATVRVPMSLTMRQRMRRHSERSREIDANSHVSSPISPNFPFASLVKFEEETANSLSLSPLWERQTGTQWSRKNIFQQVVRSRKRKNVKSILAGLEGLFEKLNVGEKEEGGEKKEEGEKIFDVNAKSKDNFLTGCNNLLRTIREKKTQRKAGRGEEGCQKFYYLPVILMKKGDGRDMSSSGWDIFSPVSEASKNLFAIIASNCRVLGYADRRRLQLTHQNFSYPFHWSLPSGLVLEETANELRTRRASLPPAHRTDTHNHFYGYSSQNSKQLSQHYPEEFRWDSFMRTLYERPANSWVRNCEQPANTSPSLPPTTHMTLRSFRDRVLSQLFAERYLPDIKNCVFLPIFVTSHQKKVPQKFAALYPMSKEAMRSFLSTSLPSSPPHSMSHFKNSTTSGKKTEGREKREKREGGEKNNFEEVLQREKIDAKSFSGVVIDGVSSLSLGRGFGVGHLFFDDFLKSFYEMRQFMLEDYQKVLSLKIDSDIYLPMLCKNYTSPDFFPCWVHIPFPRNPFA